MPDSESMLQHAPLLLSVSGMLLTRHRPFPADIVFSGTECVATNPVVLAYLLIISYFVIERLLRQGEKALSLQAGESDRGSSKVIWISGLLSILLVLLAPILNAYQIGYWNSAYVGWVGLLLMLGGLILRY
jgi:hypothetical protein